MTLLEIYKSMLGITHTNLDDRLTMELEASENELNRKGCEIDLECTDDMLLVTDYALWLHNHRGDGLSLPNNITQRIRTRIISSRAEVEDE